MLWLAKACLATAVKATAAAAADVALEVLTADDDTFVTDVFDDVCWLL